MLIQLNDLIPMATPLGRGYAILVESAPHDMWWTIALEDGSIVNFRNQQIKIERSYSYNRGINTEQMKKILEGSSKNQ